MLVVDSWSPVGRFVIWDYIGRAIALAEGIVIVCSRKFAAAAYKVNMLVVSSK